MSLVHVASEAFIMHVVLPAFTFEQKWAVFCPLSQQVKLGAEKPPCLNPHVNLGKLKPVAGWEL